MSRNGRGGHPAERGARIYRVSGTRPTRRGVETVTVIRRTWPAAKRAAERLEATGRGPARIHYAVVPAWSEILR